LFAFTLLAKPFLFIPFSVIRISGVTCAVSFYIASNGRLFARALTAKDGSLVGSGGGNFAKAFVR
jgi:hypothetical protein